MEWELIDEVYILKCAWELISTYMYSLYVLRVVSWYSIQ